MPKNLDQFNVVIVGTGGQGLITILQIMAEAALMEGYDIKTSELHGLSQRGGSVEVHIRFGKKIYSPFVSQGKADLIVALETQESIRAVPFTGSQSQFLINKYFVPIPSQKILTETQILQALNKITKKVKIIEASDICQKEVSTGVTAGIFLLGLASFNNFLPLKPGSILKAIKKVVPGQYLDLNQKTFTLTKKYAKN